MDTLKQYLIFNPKYKNLNKNQLIYQYKKDKNNLNIIKSFEEFNKKYPNFDINFYRNVNNLSDKNDIETIQHWVNYGIYNNLISTKENFYEKYNNFDAIFYDEYYKLNIEDEKDIIISYLNTGKFLNNYINKKETMENNYIDKLENIVLDNKIKKNKIKIEKIAHLFVHFFKCGGGEIFIYNFSKYIDVDNYLLLNKKYTNFVPEYLDVKIIYYENEDHLINIFNSNNFDIILDHQYYLFSNLNYFKNIIHIIHSVDLYSKKLYNNINFTINLYKENNYHDSWNGISKIINYLGVNSCLNYEKIKNKFEEYINNEKFNLKKIAIIGRIDNHKFNINFLNTLVNYCLKNKDIEVNIYGDIDKSYIRLFMKKINNVINIKYRGFINYNDINNIYINNDILIHPSKNEAGGTVLLESMNNGIITICRNKGGNGETINNRKYLVDNDDKYFEVLENLKNNININEFILDNLIAKKKILFKHNNKNNYLKLLGHIKDYKYINNTKNIPNIIHYIYGLKKQDQEFPFLFYYGILSNILINQPIKIFFHYKYIPYGYWWNKIIKYLTLNYIDYDDLELNNQKVEHYAHKSDYIRLLYIYKYGGIYYDIDTLCVKSHEYLLDNELVLGIQEKYKNEFDLIGNAVIMAKKENKFIKKIIDNYPNHFNNNDWTGASLFLPTELYNKLEENEKNNIKLLNNKYFYYPNYNEEYLLFQDNIYIPEELTTFHYCNNYNKSYLENINNIDYIINNNNLFSKLLRNIYKNIS